MNNQREDEYDEMENNRFGGYAQGNSGGGNYRGGKGSNSGRSRGNKTGNQKGGGKASASMAPEVSKAVYLVALIPVAVIVILAAYFGNALIGG